AAERELAPGTQPVLGNSAAPGLSSQALPRTPSNGGNPPTMAKLSQLLDRIDSGTILLPEFQRGYVWNRDQVRGLMRSMYLEHPVGSLLLWETSDPDLSARGSVSANGTYLMLLDGQQRITSLYGIIKGHPPGFFDGD